MHPTLKRIPAVVAAALTLALALPGAAQQPTNEQLFLSFLASPAYRNFVEQALASTDPAPLKAECARMTLREQPKYSVVRPAGFTVTNGQGAITDGVWIAYMPVDRCGTPTVRRLLIVVAGPNNLSPTRLLPGEFRGDLRLEADVQRTVLPALMELAECQDEKAVFISDVKALVTTQTAWTEQWFANACGKPASINVNYTLDANGINYTTELPFAPPPGVFTPEVPQLPLRPTPQIPQIRPGQPK